VERKNYITFISVASAIAVLTLHTNGCFWQFSATEDYWKSANIIESVFYFAVPLFFMVSGITLMDFYDRYTLREYFAKRIKKTVIPYLAWSLLGLVWKIFVDKISVDEVNLKYVYQGVTGNTIITIYWFFTSLFLIYLSMPLFAAVDKEKRKTTYTYLVIVGFVLNILVPFVKSIFGWDINTPYSVTVVSGVMIWIPLGWLLHNCELKRWHKLCIYMVALVGFLLHVCGTYVLSMEAGEVVRTYKGYLNAPSVMYAVGVFVFFKDIGTKLMEKDNKLTKLITMLSRYTFSIYLLQFVLLDIFQKYVNTKSLWYRLGAPYVMIPIIICVTWCIRKIPIIRRLVP
jgi:surface polysaccharide O-acyltransferase-like enzyme